MESDLIEWHNALQEKYLGRPMEYIEDLCVYEFNPIELFIPQKRMVSFEQTYKETIVLCPRDQGKTREKAFLASYYFNVEDKKVDLLSCSHNRSKEMKAILANIQIESPYLKHVLPYCEIANVELLTNPFGGSVFAVPFSTSGVMGAHPDVYFIDEASQYYDKRPEIDNVLITQYLIPAQMGKTREKKKPPEMHITSVGGNGDSYVAKFIQNSMIETPTDIKIPFSDIQDEKHLLEIIDDHFNSQKPRMYHAKNTALLFDWNKVPGKDTWKLLEMLRNDLNVEYVDPRYQLMAFDEKDFKNSIKKSRDGTTITVKDKSTSLTLKLEGNKLTVDTDKGKRVYYVKEEDKCLNVYRRESKDIYKYEDDLQYLRVELNKDFIHFVDKNNPFEVMHMTTASCGYSDEKLIRLSNKDFKASSDSMRKYVIDTQYKCLFIAQDTEALTTPDVVNSLFTDSPMPQWNQSSPCIGAIDKGVTTADTILVIIQIKPDKTVQYICSFIDYDKNPKKFTERIAKEIQPTYQMYPILVDTTSDDSLYSFGRQIYNLPMIEFKFNALRAPGLTNMKIIFESTLVTKDGIVPRFQIPANDEGNLLGDQLKDTYFSSKHHLHDRVAALLMALWEARSVLWEEAEVTKVRTPRASTRRDEWSFNGMGDFNLNSFKF